MASSNSKNSPALSHSSVGTKSPATQASTLSLESSRYTSKESPLDQTIDPNQPIELSGPDHKSVFPPKYTKKPGTSHHSHSTSHSRPGEPYPSRERGTGSGRTHHHNQGGPEERRASAQHSALYNHSQPQPQSHPHSHPPPQYHSQEYYPQHHHSQHQPPPPPLPLSQQQQQQQYPHHPPVPRQPMPPIQHQPPLAHYPPPEPYYHGKNGHQSQTPSQHPGHGQGHPAMTHRADDYYYHGQQPHGVPTGQFFPPQDQFSQDRRQDGLPRTQQDDFYESRHSLDQQPMYQKSARLTPQAGGAGARIKIEPDEMDIDHPGPRATPEKQIAGVKRGRS
ncbi:hypothetical protein PDE_06995 [Penicillium oxalicum 114-2]|uniref:Uncharacterized protein n=1 Tax=Penicillium oxalicum (strain 114-2 / CGMCC 5302) TaxID=933388 RepID=S7ZTE5_PENO1|nr:hypothetical protein PDE_06995 [Penicillium oxalicum 114-2]